ncbi:MAG TPA: tetratricopeptide repeat protein [Candidatus Sumerlaeota bacterium]|nr:MAG: lipoprotein NlpI [candidate division BRC1 bacterium ADurb.BinA292]HOE95817.1 tetratricopeptide repeat protein [Candidatus Sumerlaeota bacterium]HPK03715.1 tetratricopeptide repeat protein [Candidatus Sumerlaeota bacterium]
MPLFSLLRRLRPARDPMAPISNVPLSEQQLADANAALGNGYLQAGDYLRAIEAFTMAVLHDPQFARAYFMMGMAYCCLGQHRNAIGTYTQAILLRSDKAMYFFGRARAYEELGEWDEAIADYESVLALEPDHGAALHQLEELRKRLDLPTESTVA